MVKKDMLLEKAYGAIVDEKVLRQVSKEKIVAWLWIKIYTSSISSISSI